MYLHKPIFQCLTDSSSFFNSVVVESVEYENVEVVLFDFRGTGIGRVKGHVVEVHELHYMILELSEFEYFRTVVDNLDAVYQVCGVFIKNGAVYVQGAFTESSDGFLSLVTSRHGVCD